MKIEELKEKVKKAECAKIARDEAQELLLAFANDKTLDLTVEAAPGIYITIPNAHAGSAISERYKELARKYETACDELGVDVEPLPTNEEF